MKASFVLALLPVAFALPALESRQLIYIPCSGLTGSAQCCATDVLGVANLDCANRMFLRPLQFISANHASTEHSNITGELRRHLC